MTELLGFIGFIVTLLIVIPASLLACIQILKEPVKEILNLWFTLFDEILSIYEDIKNAFKK
jgi:hypothetical protein